MSCHKIKRTQSYPWENFCDHITTSIWLPNSPDWYVWGTIEWEANKTLYNTKDELKAKISATFINQNKETVGKACRRFWSRLEAVVDVNFFVQIESVTFQDIFF